MTHYHRLCSLTIFTAIFNQALIAQNLTTVDTLEAAKSNIVVTNERTINTGQLEFSPAFYEDGIVFISSQKPLAKEKIFDDKIESNTMSIFLARRDENGQLSKPTAFSNALVSSLHEGPLTFDKTGENVYFSRNNNVENGKKATYTEGVSRLKIYTAQKKGEGNWGIPAELPFNENNSDACHPTISVDGDKLYFSSNRAGGYGGMDLYVSEKINGVWGKPTNLGPKVNTPKNEVFPYIHADGTLFYSSNGLPGSGNLDIYYLKNNRQDGGLGVPVNLGAPFNSDKDDFGFIVDVDMKNGYFTSGKNGGAGGDDIYSFSMSQATLFENLNNEYAAEFDPNFSGNSANSGVNSHNNANNLGANSNNPSNSKANSNASTQLINLIVIDKQTGKAINDATASYLNLSELSMSEIIADNNGKQAQIIKSDGTFALELVESKMKNKHTNTAGKAQIMASKNGSYLISASKKGYITEQIVVKKGELQNDMVVLLSRPSDCITLTGKVKNNANGGPISYAMVSFSNEKGEVKAIPSDEMGAFTICLPCGHSYKAYATKGNAMSNVEVASTKEVNCGDGVEHALAPIELKIAAPVAKDFTINEGSSFQLRNIYYNFNDATIRPDARKDLEALYIIMTKFPDMEIELASHTDSRGSDVYNNDLSQRRATNAVEYLVNRGITSNRIVAKGYGETMLRNKCADGISCGESEHKRNRRTEVKITKSGSAEGQILTDFFSPSK
jgi:outer membrane protein OmpA-like peptidoglycan-associated protein